MQKPRNKCRDFTWLRLQVTNSLSEVERYKSDTSRLLPTGSDFSKHNEVLMTERQEIERKFTDEEIKRLAQYMNILIQMDFEQKRKQAPNDHQPLPLSSTRDTCCETVTKRKKPPLQMELQIG